MTWFYDLPLILQLAVIVAVVWMLGWAVDVVSLAVKRRRK